MCNIQFVNMNFENFINKTSLDTLKFCDFLKIELAAVQKFLHYLQISVCTLYFDDCNKCKFIKTKKSMDF